MTNQKEVMSIDMKDRLEQMLQPTPEGGVEKFED